MSVDLYKQPLKGLRVSTGFEINFNLESLPVIDKVLPGENHDDEGDSTMIHCDHGWFRLSDVAPIYDEDQYRREYEM